MYQLKAKNGSVVLRKDGEPFTYTTREIAVVGKKLLETEHKEVYTIVKV